MVSNEMFERSPEPLKLGSSPLHGLGKSQDARYSRRCNVLAHWCLVLSLTWFVVVTLSACPPIPPRDPRVLNLVRFLLDLHVSLVSVLQQYDSAKRHLSTDSCGFGSGRVWVRK